MSSNKPPAGLPRPQDPGCSLRVALLLLLLLPAAALGETKNEDLPIRIEADSADINDRKGISIYRGNVEIRQGNAIMTADQVTVQHPGKKAQKIIAVGKPVKYREPQGGEEPDIRAEALQAEYYTTSKELIMIGDAVIFQGGDSIRSDRITYDRKSGMLKSGASAQGKQRAIVTIDSE